MSLCIVLTFGKRENWDTLVLYQFNPGGANRATFFPTQAATAVRRAQPTLT